MLIIFGCSLIFILVISWPFRSLIKLALKRFYRKKLTLEQLELLEELSGIYLMSDNTLNEVGFEAGHQAFDGAYRLEQDIQRLRQARALEQKCLDLGVPRWQVKLYLPKNYH